MPCTSERWGYLPNELIDLVTAYCGRDCLETKWMFVNKHWFEFYLSKAYRSISINLSTSDKKFNQILHSQFNIGKWIKCISFEKLHPPDDIYQINKLDDPLLVLMKLTPNVEEVQSSSSSAFDVSDWTYFSTTLISTKYWKLRALPEITETKLNCSGHYFSCAYNMRRSLKKINLSLGMIDISNNDSFKHFPALEILNIGKGLVDNFIDLDIALQSLTTLKEIAVKFSVGHIDPLQSEPRNRYLNIKEMTLENFISNLDTKITAFTKCFPNLCKVKIIEREKNLWPSNEINHNSTQVLFGFLDFISEYEITVAGDNNAANLITQWSKWIKPIKKDSLTVEFSRNPFTDNPGIVNLTIKNDKSSSETIFYHYNQNYSTGLNALEQIKNTVFYVKLKNLPKDSNAGGSNIRALIQKSCPNLETLVLDDCFFEPLPSDIKPPNTRLKSLEFYNCSLQGTSFQIFTKQFLSLDFLVFDSCLFSLNTKEEINTINMSNCNIKRMCISDLEAEVHVRSPITRLIEAMTKFFFLSIYFASKCNTQYYLIMNRKFVEVDKIIFDYVWISTYVGTILRVKIETKSINELFIKMKNESEYIKIFF